MTHRRRNFANHELLTLALVVLSVLVILMFIRMLSLDGSGEVAREPSAAVAPPTVTVTRLAQADPAGLKPIKDNKGGEKVILWRNKDPQPHVCKWIEWGGQIEWIDFSTIRCPGFNKGQEFTVKTAYLTPAEPR